MVAIRSSLVRWGCAAVVVVAGLAWLIDPASTDRSNAAFRSWLFAEVGTAPWNNMWFGGHHTPTYSLLAPPLTSMVGVTGLGVVSALATVVTISGVLHASGVPLGGRVRRDLVGVALGASAAAPMIIVQSAYALGVPLGAAAVWAASRSRPVLGASFAVLAASAAPSSGLLLAVVGAAWCVATWPVDRRQRWQRGAALVVVPLAAMLGMAAAFPSPPLSIPFPIGAFVVAIGVVAVVGVVGRRWRVLRYAAVFYAVLLVAVELGAIDLGHVATRLAGLLAAPLTLLWAPQRLVGGAAAVVLLAYQWMPVTGVAFADLGPVVTAEAFAPLFEVIDGYDEPIRVEVVPMRGHHEADFVARRTMIARGWQSQLDRSLNPLFYGGELTPAAYEEWLTDSAVTLVAIADVRLDFGGTAERALLEQPPPYLREVYADDLWRIFEVVPQPQLVTGPARLVAVDPASFTLQFSQPGVAEVRITHSPWFTVDGAGCVAATDGGNTRVVAFAAGDVRVAATLSGHGVRSLVGIGEQCPAS
jgi:hypothetical protein